VQLNRKYTNCLRSGSSSSCSWGGQLPLLQHSPISQREAAKLM
jgi:hypothetical protein